MLGWVVQPQVQVLDFQTNSDSTVVPKMSAQLELDLVLTGMTLYQLPLQKCHTAWATQNSAVAGQYGHLYRDAPGDKRVMQLVAAVQQSCITLMGSQLWPFTGHTLVRMPMGLKY
jgi:hypothetical protein